MQGVEWARMTTKMVRCSPVSVGAVRAGAATERAGCSGATPNDGRSASIGDQIAQGVYAKASGRGQAFMLITGRFVLPEGREPGAAERGGEPPWGIW